MPDRKKAYAEAGVNLDAANSLVSRIKKLVQETHTKGVVSDIGGFGGLFKPSLEGMEEPILVSATDGVGTKIKLAVAYSRHQDIGVDLVAMSVNDILVQGAKPLFFLDYLALGHLDLNLAETLVGGVANGCKESECALIGGETAEMPDMYARGDYDMAGFCVGLVDNASIVDGSGVRVGDDLIGLASNGPHSNGYSLIRKIVDKAGLGPDDSFPGTDRTAAEVLLAPTSIYVKPVRNLLRDFEIKGMAHITGGGFYDNIPRVLPRGVRADIDFGSWEIPPVFHWLKEVGELDWPAMLQVFNCGVGYVLIVDNAISRDVLDRLNDNLNQKAWLIGKLSKADKDEEQVQFGFGD